MKLLEVFKKLIDGIWLFILSIIFIILLIPALLILLVFTLVEGKTEEEDIIEKE